MLTGVGVGVGVGVGAGVGAVVDGLARVGDGDALADGEGTTAGRYGTDAGESACLFFFTGGSSSSAGCLPLTWSATV